MHCKNAVLQLANCCPSSFSFSQSTQHCSATNWINAGIYIVKCFQWRHIERTLKMCRWFGRSVMGKFEVLEAMDVSWSIDAGYWKTKGCKQAQVLLPIDDYLYMYLYVHCILNYLVINCCCIQETSLTSNPWGPFYRSWKCCCSSFGGLAGTFHRAPTNRNVNPCRKNHVDANGWLMVTDSLTWVVCSIRADELAGGVPVFLALPASMFK